MAGNPILGVDAILTASAALLRVTEKAKPGEFEEGTFSRRGGSKPSGGEAPAEPKMPEASPSGKIEIKPKAPSPPASGEAPTPSEPSRMRAPGPPEMPSEGQQVSPHGGLLGRVASGVWNAAKAVWAHPLGKATLGAIAGFHGLPLIGLGLLGASLHQLHQQGAGSASSGKPGSPTDYSSQTRTVTRRPAGWFRPEQWQERIEYRKDAGDPVSEEHVEHPEGGKTSYYSGPREGIEALADKFHGALTGGDNPHEVVGDKQYGHEAGEIRHMAYRDPATGRLVFMILIRDPQNQHHLVLEGHSHGANGDGSKAEDDTMTDSTNGATTEATSPSSASEISRAMALLPGGVDILRDTNDAGWLHFGAFGGGNDIVSAFSHPFHPWTNGRVDAYVAHDVVEIHVHEPWDPGLDLVSEKDADAALVELSAFGVPWCFGEHGEIVLLLSADQASDICKVDAFGVGRGVGQAIAAPIAVPWRVGTAIGRGARGLMSAAGRAASRFGEAFRAGRMGATSVAATGTTTPVRGTISQRAGIGAGKLVTGLGSGIRQMFGGSPETRRQAGMRVEEAYRQGGVKAPVVRRVDQKPGATAPSVTPAASLPSAAASRAMTFAAKRPAATPAGASAAGGADMFAGGTPGGVVSRMAESAAKPAAAAAAPGRRQITAQDVAGAVSPKPQGTLAQMRAKNPNWSSPPEPGDAPRRKALDAEDEAAEMMENIECAMLGLAAISGLTEIASKE